MPAVSAPRAYGVWRTIATGLLLAGAATIVVTLLAATGSDRLGYDFHEAYLPAAEAVLDGESPYPSPRSAVVEEGRAYVYPPQLAYLLTPFTALPTDAAAFLAFLCAAAALLGALAIAGVRDPRCYAGVLLWAPAFNALEMANASAALALGVAIAWRFRASVPASGGALGVIVSTKLFLWPLVLWTAAMRRYRSAGLAVCVGVALTAAAWAAIDFDGLTSYPRLLDSLSDAHAENSYSLVGAAAALGLEPWAGRVLMLFVGGGLLVATLAFARAHDDRRAFTSAVAAALALTPILWQHHLVVLVVPLALARPRFSALWLAPAALWLAPRAGNGDGLEPLLPALVVAVVVLVTLARPTWRMPAVEAV